MADNTAIEWTHRPGTKGETWNPTVGCSILSPGCTHCYAMGEAARQVRCAAGLKRDTHYAGTVKTVKGRAVWTGKINLAPDHILTKPLRWREPRTVFVNSMSDLFHESIPDAWIDKVVAVMALTPHHTYQLLTKRADRMMAYFDADDRSYAIGAALGTMLDGEWIWKEGKQFRAQIEGMISLAHGLSPDLERFAREDFLPLPNVWLGVSAERQQEADERIPLLLQTPAAVRFISAEPLLGPIDLQSPGYTGFAPDGGPNGLTHLDWVIVGGESGPNARPMHPDWARALRDQCKAAGMPFFFKQWGEFAPVEVTMAEWLNQKDPRYLGERIVSKNGEFSGFPCDGGKTCHVMRRLGKKSAGRLLDSALHNEFPQAKELAFG